MTADYWYNATRHRRRFKAKLELQDHRWWKAHRREAAKTYKLIELNGAFHEAAHACVALSQGVCVTRATIRGDDGDGHVSVRVNLGHLQTRAIIAYAGPAMDRKRCHDDGDKFCQADIDYFDEMIAKMGGSAEERAANRRALETITHERLDELMPAITRVARGLMRRSTLTGDEIKALYDGAEAREAA